MSATPMEDAIRMKVLDSPGVILIMVVQLC